MTKKPIIIYLPEGFADWEGAFLLPELRQVRRAVAIVSDTGDSVTSIGGLKVAVDRSVSEISPEDIEALVLIGSDSWAEPNQNKRVLTLAQDLYNRGILVAGICAATVALARVGLLDERKHTSNDLEMLKKLVPTYNAQNNYVKTLAVTDGNLITAAGIGPVEFTYEVLSYLGIYSEEKRLQWFRMYKEGEMPPVEFWSEEV